MYQIPDFYNGKGIVDCTDDLGVLLLRNLIKSKRSVFVDLFHMLVKTFTDRSGKHYSFITARYSSGIKLRKLAITY